MSKLFKIGVCLAAVAGVGYAVKKALENVDISVEVTPCNEPQEDDCNHECKCKCHNKEADDESDDDLGELDEPCTDDDIQSFDDLMNELNKASKLSDDNSDNNDMPDIDELLDDMQSELDKDAASDDANELKQATADFLESSAKLAKMLKDSAKSKATATVTKISPKVEQAINTIIAEGEKALNDAFESGEAWAESHPEVVKGITDSADKLYEKTNSVIDDFEKWVTGIEEKMNEACSNSDSADKADSAEKETAGQTEKDTDISDDPFECDDPFEPKKDDLGSVSPAPGLNIDKDLTNDDKGADDEIDSTANIAIEGLDIDKDLTNE